MTEQRCAICYGKGYFFGPDGTKWCCGLCPAGTKWLHSDLGNAELRRLIDYCDEKIREEDARRN